MSWAIVIYPRPTAPVTALLIGPQVVGPFDTVESADEWRHANGAGTEATWLVRVVELDPPAEVAEAWRIEREAQA